MRSLVWIGCWLLTATALAAAEPGVTRVAKAAPDEFFAGIGKGYYPLGTQPPDLPGQPKVNQMYVWGMTNTADSIWFGTAANPISLVIGGMLGNTNPFQTQYNVSEFGKSKYPDISPILRAPLGDWRPPQVFRYRPGIGAEDMTPDDPLIKQTIGLRSAGANDEIVLLAGPNMNQLSINVFAFDAQSGAYLGARALIEYADIRQWVMVDGVLYTGVLDSFAVNGGGSVLRWKGTRGNPFQYEVVGKLDNEAASLVPYQGRLIALTWAQVSPFWSKLFNAQASATAGIWMSPPIPAGGLTTAQQRNWKKVWASDNYDPDPVLAQSVWMGAAAAHDGHIVWGTLQIPGLGPRSLVKAYGFPNLLLLPTSFENSLRTAAVFRGKLNDAGEFQAEVLYGDATLPRYFSTGKRKGFWLNVPNRTGPPKLGPAGFGQPATSYIWSMGVHQDQLFVGTFDRSFLFYGDDYVLGNPVPDDLGADVVVFTKSDQAAGIVSRTGLGNVTNHGVRTMVSFGNRLYCGTASCANLLTNPNDALPEGGWELLELDASQLAISRLSPARKRTPLPEAEQQRLLNRWGTIEP